MYFIQGCFCQLTIDPIMRKDGTYALRAAASLVFAGRIWKEPDGHLVGDMIDRLGQSDLYDIEMFDTEFRFAKRYRNRRYPDSSGLSDPHYHLRKSETDNTWTGEYDIPVILNAAGPVRCILTEIDDALFESDLLVYAVEHGVETEEAARASRSSNCRSREEHILTPGTRVRTTKPDMSKRREWTEAGWASKRWRIEGTVKTHHDSHGLCYDVIHDGDGSLGCYEPTEIECI